ncbi:DUF6624 domain-containing protein [Sphingomonas sp. TDK1]|uniref:DUF6624 domain-containing protein n=1 Tax=Sphingomonas sp. TDK1 TaxID=453247 RepID=UPI0007DA33F9|nr:DUF6624 domain-containing protein [Sphingomonas sp. TDK1]OAN57166.1 hypothetical protein A7X12_08040 [Sphingomonas sp. TDK1]
MIGPLMLLAAACSSPDAKIAPVLARWCSALDEAERGAPAPTAPLREQMLYLVRLDEVTRQNLWMVDDPSLDGAQRRAVGELIGQDLRRIDARTTTALRRLLPKTGWFSNRVHGRQVTHGAWLIAQHSPDDSFREYALEKMALLVKSGDVDAKDYALTFDRVRVHKGLPQRYGSQTRCVDGRRALFPLQDERAVNQARDSIGWAQTLEETKGDLEVGRPCDG